ncbi:MAG: DUF29 family protein, partial [Pseudanabaena sp.]
MTEILTEVDKSARSLYEQWEQLVFQSPYLAVIKAKELLQEGQMTEAYNVLESLAESMGRSERKAVSSQLTRLMLHIIKWRDQPEKRSPS